jgi:hypothetical protein
LRARFERQNRELGIQSSHAFEFFTVTAWGAMARYEAILHDFPALDNHVSNLAQIKRCLARWSGEP